MTAKERINDLGKNFYFLCRAVAFNTPLPGMFRSDQRTEVSAYGDQRSIATRLLKIITTSSQ